MSLIDVAKDVAADVGIRIPGLFASSTEREHVEMLSYINAAGEEIARRVDWGGLRVPGTVTGTGVAEKLAMPTDFARLTDGNAVTVAGAPVRGGLSADEFNSLPATSGTPRYFLLSGDKILFWPYLALAATVSVLYQSKNWAVGGTPQPSLTADSNTTVFPEVVLTKGSIARWRRQKGMDHSSYSAEYEQALLQYADFDARDRSP